LDNGLLDAFYIPSRLQLAYLFTTGLNGFMVSNAIKTRNDKIFITNFRGSVGL